MTRRWVIAGLATAEVTTDVDPQCPVCTGGGRPTAAVPHVHHPPDDPDVSTARVFVFDTYETDE